eukprot:scaffold7344_cov145-Cylindrotheca_fusiformis.AAC.9
MQVASSPFDQAMARPLLDEPTRKKWRLGKKASSWFEKTASMAVALTANDNACDVDESETISFLPKEKSPDLEPASPGSNLDDNIDNLALSLDSINESTKSSQGLFLHKAHQHPLEIPAVTHDVSTTSHPLALEMVDIDLECANTDLEIMRERQAELTTIHSDMQQIHSIQLGKRVNMCVCGCMCGVCCCADTCCSSSPLDLAGVVDSHQEDIDRLSWNAIEAFRHTESGLEHMIQAVGHQQERKSKLHSFLASAVVVLVVCYVVAGFFAPPDDDAAAVSSRDEQGSPKFLIRYFNP